METDPQLPALSPEDVHKKFERLQSDLSLIQNEFNQALGVWRAILVSEKQEFSALVSEKEQAWDRDESQWQASRQAYEQKIQDVETFFNEKLRATEKNAVYALNELDAAWQQERTRWQETVTEQTKKIEQANDSHLAAQQDMTQRIDQLVIENAQLQARVEQVQSLEKQLTEWQAEKVSWQEALTDRLSELQQAKEAWATDRSEKDALIASLQEECALLKKQSEDRERAAQNETPHVRVYMNTLETQVAALEDFVQQVIHPRRRKTDASATPPSLPPPSSRARN